MNLKPLWMERAAAPIRTTLADTEFMGHEVVIHGIIEGALNTDACSNLVESNAVVIRALPPPNPQGTYRTTVLHFGLSLKDEPPRCSDADCDPESGWPQSERPAIYEWLTKFESLLRQLYWYGADVYFSTDFESPMHVSYQPTNDAIDAMHAEPSTPIQSWEREISFSHS